MLYGSLRGVSRGCMRRVSVSYLTTPIFHTNAGEDQEGEVAMPPRRSSLDHGGSRHARATRLKKLRRRDSLGQNRHIKTTNTARRSSGARKRCNKMFAATMCSCTSTLVHDDGTGPTCGQIVDKSTQRQIVVVCWCCSDPRIATMDCTIPHPLCCRLNEQ